MQNDHSGVCYLTLIDHDHPAYRPIDIPVGAGLSDLLNTRPRFDVGTTA